MLELKKRVGDFLQEKQTDISDLVQAYSDEKYPAWNRGSLAKKIDSSITRRLATYSRKSLTLALLNGEIWRGSLRSHPEEMETLKKNARNVF
ncbi:19715_t:CDS:2 [Cetraspora pellucida]|uniref:19715_t:CDS:1 n=1 Tax=Cetraspora pellucida TaxID=1433469 RepID=A0A9N9B7L9_9GLOM|nr:19715_t:CDS:2 [Cetraspora pellucida]